MFETSGVGTRSPKHMSEKWGNIIYHYTIYTPRGLSDVSATECSQTLLGDIPELTGGGIGGGFEWHCFPVCVWHTISLLRGGGRPCLGEYHLEGMLLGTLPGRRIKGEGHIVWE